MCPVCLATSLYIAGGVSAGAITTFLAASIWRWPFEPSASSTAAKSKGDEHAPSNDRIEK